MILMTRKKKARGSDDLSRVDLREQILGEGSEELASRPRSNQIMTRLSNEIVEILDALIELGVFNSRSEAVAVYVERSILTKLDMYKKLKEQAKQIGKMRESVAETALDIFRDPED